MTTDEIIKSLIDRLSEAWPIRDDGIPMAQRSEFQWDVISALAKFLQWFSEQSEVKDGADVERTWWADRICDMAGDLSFSPDGTYSKAAVVQILQRVATMIRLNRRNWTLDPHRL